MRLALCGSCARQYDVSSLPAGSAILCVCGVQVRVPAHAPLAIEALFCAGCGGPALAGQASCAYCGAGFARLERSAGTLCPACGTRMDDDARHCPGCALAIRPQALAALPAGARCPRCGGSLCVRAMPGASAIECGRCLGLWLAAREFDALCAHAASGEHARPRPGLSGAAENAAPLFQEPVRYIPCLSCGELMQRRMFTWKGRASRAIVDVCREHGIWLDAGELARVLGAVARGAGDAGQPPPEAGELAESPAWNRALARALAQDSPRATAELFEWLGKLGRGALGRLG